jgi:class 3 adenylate cyclase/tetratricopeptide (TPR) repeat protein
VVDSGHESRRTVTVVFTDVTGSTALGETLDPEAVRRVMERYFQTASDVIERHGGTVEKFIGDAVMAVFGVPRLHEDDALRAVRAAAEMQQALGALNEELDRDWGVMLQTRTGVNTGEVVAGDPGGTGHALVTGDAVNVAARLEQLAGPGEILIGDTTRALTENAIRVAAVGPLDARGKSSPLTAWLLLEVLDDEPYRRRLDTPLIGRGDELRQLWDVYTRCVRQRSCALFTVIGPGGIGKSRLIREFLHSAEGDAVVLTGRCLPYGEGITYWPLVEIVRSVAGEDIDLGIRRAMADDPDGPRVGRLLAAMAGAGTAPVPADTEDLSWAARRLFEALSRTRPLVVAFEDINFAEPTLLDLITDVARWTRESPVMLLCTARDELLEMRPTWAGGLRNATTALLEPLSPNDAADLVDQLLAQPMPEHVRERVIALAGGNPLFVEQLLATLAAGRQADVDALSTIHAVISARLDSLPEDECTLLECASVIGKEFGAEPLAAVLGRDPGAALGALVQRDLVRPSRSAFHGTSAYRFGHLLIRDSAYTRIPKRRRAELHERLAGWIRTSGIAADVDSAEMVGYHLEQAYLQRTALGPADPATRNLAHDAARTLAAAGERAQRRMDAPAAANLLSRAAVLLADDPGERLELLPDVALALMRRGDDARPVLDEALGISIELGDSRNEHRAMLGHAFVLWSRTGDGVELERTAERAIPVLEAAEDSEGLVRAWLWRGFARTSLSRYGDALDAFELARRHLADAGPMAEERTVFGNLALCLWLSEAPCAQAIERCRELVEQEQERHATAEAHIAIPLAMLLAGCGRTDEATSVLSRSSDVFARSPAVSRAEMAYYTGVVHQSAGDLTGAEDSISSALAIAEEHQHGQILCEVEASMATVLCELGRKAEALRHAEASRGHAAPGDVGNQIAWRSALARAVAGTHRAEEAAVLAGQAVDLASGTDSPVIQGDALLAAADVLLANGRGDEAREAAGRAHERYAHKGLTTWMARAQRIAAGDGATAPRAQ